MSKIMKFYILVAYEYVCKLNMIYCLKLEITKKKKSSVCNFKVLYDR